ncbi:MAG: DNA translocase FtsK [Marinifilaceae bacterium]|jgi:S-DNA-T family DNA segregation ATPase FtsK/SpoIIIE|nr:DNA translocase FtsK [Marinifilaceae bacterium]
MAKKKKKNKKSVDANLANVFIPWHSKKMYTIYGIVFCSFSVLMIISFLSFFTSGGIDQSKLDIETLEYIINPKIVVNNLVGKLGASIANFFINCTFGIPSFIFSYLLFISGLKCLKVYNRSLKRPLILGSIGVFWLSIAFDYIFSNIFNHTYVFPGGMFGFHMKQWFVAAMGQIGTGVLLAVVFSIIIIFAFPKFFPYVARLMNVILKNKRQDEDLDEDYTSEDSTYIEDVIEDEDSSYIDESLFEKDTINANEDFDSQDSNKHVFTDDLSLNFEEKESKNKKTQNTGKDDEVELIVENDVKEETVKENKVQLEDYDPTLELSSYKFPSIDLLESHDANNKKVTTVELEDNKNRIVETLRNYKIEIVKIMATIGPTVTLYEIVPAPGVRISKIKNLEDDIALSLSALGIRIIAPIPGKGTVGIEVPNLRPEVVSMKSVIGSKKFQEAKYALPVALGKTISNEPYIFDLAKMPHLLVAGATGQGKSVGLNAIITSLLYKKHPSQLKFVMVDPKKVELSIYSVIEKHFLAKLPDAEEPIITDVGKVVATLNSLCTEMDARYDLLKKATVRNIKEYNAKFTKRRLNPDKGHRYLPYIVVVVDEFADLIMTAGKEVEQPIARIAQLARAVGIHMIIATQRPSTNIITGLIKANFPARIAFKVASMIDSRTILDAPGANQLIGRGDLLVSVSSEMVRVQCAFVDTPEVDAITEFIADQKSFETAFMLPEFIPEPSGGEAGEIDLGNRDPLFNDAAHLIVHSQQGSTSSIQRRFSIGYARAGRIIDQLEAAGVVGPFEGSKARQVLVPDDYALEQLLSNL